MNNNLLRDLIRQPEGLKLDFKSEFYQIDSKDPNARERQWGELIKDILALANGNVNIAGETGYIIFGVGDKISIDGTRELSDVGYIKVTRQQILDKVNAASSPPLSDLHCDLLLLDGQRIFVISIPPTPHIHETTRQLITSRGQSYPEHTIFIRRGEGIHTASMLEIQAILAEKQRTIKNVATPSCVSDTIQKREGFSGTFINQSFILTLVISCILAATWGAVSGVNPNRIVGAITGVFVGAIFGTVFSLVIKIMRWIISHRPAIKTLLSFVLWAPIAGIIVIALFLSKDFPNAVLNIIVGAIFGLMIGVILVLILWVVDWIVTMLRSINLPKS
jgi:hypothetical protein